MKRIQIGSVVAILFSASFVAAGEGIPDMTALNQVGPGAYIEVYKRIDLPARNYAIYFQDGQAFAGVGDGFDYSKPYCSLDFRSLDEAPRYLPGISAKGVRRIVFGKMVDLGADGARSRASFLTAESEKTIASVFCSKPGELGAVTVGDLRGAMGWKVGMRYADGVPKAALGGAGAPNETLATLHHGSDHVAARSVSGRLTKATTVSGGESDPAKAQPSSAAAKPAAL